MTNVREQKRDTRMRPTGETNTALSTLPKTPLDYPGYVDDMWELATARRAARAGTYTYTKTSEDLPIRFSFEQTSDDAVSWVNNTVHLTATRLSPKNLRTLKEGHNEKRMENKTWEPTYSHGHTKDCLQVLNVLLLLHNPMVSSQQSFETDFVKQFANVTEPKSMRHWTYTETALEVIPNSTSDGWRSEQTVYKGVKSESAGRRIGVRVEPRANHKTAQRDHHGRIEFQQHKRRLCRNCKLNQKESPRVRAYTQDSYASIE